LWLLGLSALFFLSILAGKAGDKFGIPALLLFLMVGMLCGSDGLGIQFEKHSHCPKRWNNSIMYNPFFWRNGYQSVRNPPHTITGISLATIRVFLTALITGVNIWWILGLNPKNAGFGFLSSLLLASTMSSTDSASVFSILRSKGLYLKNNLRPMLELEVEATIL
jgi:cell volume regulation protein A